MVQSVELLLDEASEATVVAQWQALADHGLPSQAAHRSPSNRPHVTLAAVGSLDEVAERRVVHACAGLGRLEVRVGPLVLLGAQRVVLARLVVATRQLLDVQRAVAEACAVPEDDLGAVGRWLPHVTLARQVPPDRLSDAVRLLAGDDLTAQVAGVRRWDSVARRTWTVGRG